PKIDDLALIDALQSEAFYVGALGSHTNTQKRKERLREFNLSTEQGVRVPRDIIREFVCTYNGRLVFRADLHPGIGSNPIFIFDAKADQSGMIECKWSGDNGYLTVLQQPITVL
ncbi:MAG: hypothetical protein EBY73_02980, partial [Burkholderiaceae bacterium]|nr:hypothetical protein [Burkholderiaceae bacterium]